MALRRLMSSPQAVATAALLLVTGSAYAGLTVGRNSVGSPQVKDNSLTSRDVRDGALKRKDLGPAAAPKTYTFIGDVALGTPTPVIDIPGFSRFDVTCTATPSQSIFVGFGGAGQPAQRHFISGSDLADNNPVGAAEVTGPGGGVGISASPVAIIFEGQYFGRSADLLAHGDWSIGYPNVDLSSCRVRVQVVVERLASPVPLPRTGPAGEARCVQEVGAGFCVLD